jgi:hypothetical protein
MKRGKLKLDEDKVMADLEAIRLAAMEAGAFAPALRVVELQGKHIGLWATKPEGNTPTLLELITASMVEPKDGEP